MSWNSWRYSALNWTIDKGLAWCDFLRLIVGFSYKTNLWLWLKKYLSSFDVLLWSSYSINIWPFKYLTKSSWMSIYSAPFLSFLNLLVDDFKQQHLKRKHTKSGQNFALNLLLFWMSLYASRQTFSTEFTEKGCLFLRLCSWLFVCFMNMLSISVLTKV